ncbi:MAG: 4-hydroxybenzoyl-CoA thioesterase [Tenericutes bacterium HGW-Tenericutes-2]|jgi:acyl-CoA thioester hydrolase|nr:MAG: 4-hydroxybenzoyl-CoA thioesterase [Tenericutes bacterium HGW-Tenericutes-2]
MKSLITIEPRYQETDQMGVIHHSVYAVWFEMGRVKYCDDIGFPFKKIEDSGLRLAMIDLRSIYKKPALFGNQYKQYTYLIDFSRIRMTFRYEIYNEKDELIHVGESVLVWLDTNLRPTNVLKSNKQIYDLFAKHVVKAKGIENA